MLARITAHRVRPRAGRDVWDAKHNILFQRNAILVELIKADWDMDKVSDSVLLESNLFMIWTRGTEAQQRQRTAARNLPWSAITNLKDIIEKTSGGGTDEEQETTCATAYQSNGLTRRGGGGLSTPARLEFARHDIIGAICGSHPVLAINHGAVALTAGMLFLRIQKKLHDIDIDTGQGRDTSAGGWHFRL